MKSGSLVVCKCVIGTQSFSETGLQIVLHSPQWRNSGKFHLRTRSECRCWRDLPYSLYPFHISRPRVLKPALTCRSCREAGSRPVWIWRGIDWTRNGADSGVLAGRMRPQTRRMRSTSPLSSSPWPKRASGASCRWWSGRRTRSRPRNRRGWKLRTQTKLIFFHERWKRNCSSENA